ncbi:MAG TPA: VWA domain-containing protein [Acidimicrobiales bacterium]|nr:VWA domain-containing protein [Acidimicrobiales bacterium]
MAEAGPVPVGATPAGSGGQGTRMAVAFVRVLRRSGLSVPVGAAVAFARALGAVGLERRSAVYWAGRATLVRRPEDVAAYDRAFAVFWLGRENIRVPVVPTETVVVLHDESDEAGAGPDDPPSGPDRPAITVRYSPVETLRDRDFAQASPEELEEAYRVMARLRLESSRRRSRRLVRSSRRRGRPDARRTVLAALRSGGEPVRRSFLEPATRPRRVVLLCDVSGSMEPYARALLRFLHVAVVGVGQVEAFALGTRLTRLTRQLATHDPDRALAAAAEAVPDWSGGTRLGEGLRAFNDSYGIKGMARGAVVVILSDGWDRGEPELLGTEMARLHRVAHRVVWVNPLKASPGYAPLARGMAAALPYVDSFVEGHSLASLEALTEVIAA